MAQVVLEQVWKIYPGRVTAVKDFNLAVRARELIVIVGPSGCGKSTTLRMIAGLEEISRGSIRIGARLVNDMPPKDRDIAMVFQNYALYPHMSVYENMAFGLRLRKIPRSLIEQRVRRAAAILELNDYLDRKPKALSGGQRQRVALGRAIVREPTAFLFDEPLSNLDARMRVQMRSQIAKLHLQLAATMIYVTHDQSEAMSLADRIVVMNAGEIQQIAAPIELYDRPANLFCAAFIGTPAMNFFEGQLQDGAQGCQFSAATFQAALPPELAALARPWLGQPVILGLRPEQIGSPAAEAQTAAARISGRVLGVEPLGAETYVTLAAGSTRFCARLEAHRRCRPGDELSLALLMARAHLFDPRTTRRLGAEA